MDGYTDVYRLYMECVNKIHKGGKITMFKFRIITTPEGIQVIDQNLLTPYESLTPLQMLEYIKVDNSLYYMKKLERKRKKEAQHKNKWYMKLTGFLKSI